MLSSLGLEPNAVEVAGDRALFALEGEELAVIHYTVQATGAYPEVAQVVAVPLAHWLVSKSLSKNGAVGFTNSLNWEA